MPAHEENGRRSQQVRHSGGGWSTQPLQAHTPGNGNGDRSFCGLFLSTGTTIQNRQKFFYRPAYCPSIFHTRHTRPIDPKHFCKLALGPTLSLAENLYVSSLKHERNVHNAHQNVKSKRTPMLCKMHAMSFDDRPDSAKRLEKARVARGFADAKSAAKYFGWKYDSYAQHENGTRGITRVASQYAKAFRVSEAWLLTGEGRAPGGMHEVPLKGRVGAGAEVYAIDDGGNDTAPAPADANPETVAVEVSGESMYPAYEDGTLLYYSKLLPPDEMVNRRCVVQLSSGKIYVKVLRKGSELGLYTLQSLNHMYPDIPDQHVDWAAPIDWVRPR